MEINEIKTQLTLAEIIKHYGYKADKYNRINCPFHDDITPSMQLYWKTHTAFCFSSNCKTNGKSLDVIDFVMHKESVNKHEAIEKCKSMITGTTPTTSPAAQLTKAAILTKMFTYFKNGVHNSKPAQEFIQSRTLDYTKLEIGYNSGQFHHGTRKDEALIKSCLQIGLLSEHTHKSKTGETAYVPFGKYGIVFALRNKHNHVTGMYFRSTVNNNESKHFYLKDREGIYPKYPESSTEKLILTEAIIDAATLLQIPAIVDQYSIISAYGTNGLNDEIKAAIEELKALKEIIFAFDNDEAGNKATEKYAAELKQHLPNITLSKLNLPDGEDINSTAQAHSFEIFTHLLEQRTAIIFSTEKKSEAAKPTENKAIQPSIKKEEQVKIEQNKPETLNSENPYSLYYKGKAADYYIKGGIRCPLDSLKISLQIVHTTTREDIRSKTDLYEYKQVESLIKSATEKLSLSNELLEKDLSTLTKLIETHRTEQMQQQGSAHKKIAIKVPEATIYQCTDFLSEKYLIKRLGDLLGQAGITGEENNRIFLFGIAGSYKMPDTLHALIQGSSGSGKTRLLKIICELMPKEDTIRFTRVTDSSFYNYPEDYLVNKLLGFEDIDGLKEDALYAVRELISNEILVSSTTTKSESGQIMAAERTVRGPISSISCTTKGAIYEDNMSRVFLIAVDESKEQTKKIITYQQQKAAGLIDRAKEKQVREFLANCIRILKPYEVINPYADKIHLPEEAHKIRRLNDLYLSFVKQITLIHQFQRSKDKQGRLISTIEDLQTANNIMFESIVLKIDELDGSLRQFYEKLKAHVKKTSKDNTFLLREVRQAMHMSKTQLHRYISDLTQFDYIQQAGGFANRGFTYKITYWDDIQAIRSRIKKHLQDQIDSLSKKN